MNTNQKTLNLGEALSLAVSLQQRGRLQEAEKIYSEILRRIPDHPDALHFLGILSYQKGEPRLAIELIEKAIAANPNHPDAYNNLGNILKSLGRLNEAETAYTKAVSLDPDHADAYSNLGVVYSARDQLEKAAAAFCKTISLNPDHAEAHYNLGNVFDRKDEIQKAIASYRRAVAINPRHFEALKQLGLALQSAGEYTKAVAVFRQWLEIDPENPVALHMLAACSGEKTPERASDAYVQRVFDKFADSFDEHLKRLDYRAPRLLLKAVSQALPAPNAQFEVLDAGCGTGLCGPLLRPYARRLTGVDLSPGMLAKASERDIYDELIAAELTAFLRRSPVTYDLIVSADTLVYFGELSAVLEAAANALRVGGRLAFTLEEAEDAKVGFRLNPYGRYSHTEAYVRAIAGAAGLMIDTLAHDKLRMERGQPVQGLVMVAYKPAEYLGD